MRHHRGGALAHLGEPRRVQRLALPVELRKITPDGAVSTLAGSPGVSGTNNGTGSNASISFPEGIAVDPDGVVTLYQYNAKGEQEYIATDMDRDDAIGLSGTDRIFKIG